MCNIQSPLYLFNKNIIRYILKLLAKGRVFHELVIRLFDNFLMAFVLSSNLDLVKAELLRSRCLFGTSTSHIYIQMGLLLLLHLVVRECHQNIV